MELSLLENLPTELRLEIMEYLLPLDHNGEKRITTPVLQTEDSCLSSLQYSESQPSHLSIRRFLKGIALTLHILRNDALHVVFQRTFIFRISARTLNESTKCRFCNSTCHEDYRCRNLSTRFLPGLDLTQTNLKVQVIPDERATTWWYIGVELEYFMKNLKKRIGDQCVRKLTLEILETQKRLSWTYWSEYERRLDHPSDSIWFIDILCRILIKACECDIRLPVYAQNDEHTFWLVEDTKKAVCTRQDASEVGPNPVALITAWSEEPAMCLPPRKESAYWPSKEREEQELKWFHEYPWMKVRGDEWDDWYDLENYDLRDVLWVFDELKNVDGTRTDV